MMGIPISGPTYGFVDNLSVIQNSHEAVVMKEILMIHGWSTTNPTDLFTKVLPG
jgi:hypothetical protein